MSDYSFYLETAKRKAKELCSDSETDQWRMTAVLLAQWHAVKDAQYEHVVRDYERARQRFIGAGEAMETVFGKHDGTTFGSTENQ